MVEKKAFFFFLFTGINFFSWVLFDQFWMPKRYFAAMFKVTADFKFILSELSIEIICYAFKLKSL